MIDAFYNLKITQIVIKEKTLMSDKTKKIIKISILIALVAIICFSVWQLISKSIYEKKAKEEYEKLSQYTEVTENVIEDDVIEPVIEPQIAEESMEVVEVEAVPSDFFVDFPELDAINSDLKGWIVINSVDISYPLVQGDDNEYYLEHSFEKENLSAGCIFVDYENNGDFSDLNTYIYGHNMKNKTMFGSLKNIIDDESLLEADPYIYIYTPEYKLTYKIFSYYITRYDSDRFELIETQNELEEYEDVASELSLTNFDYEYTGEKIITLTTCNGAPGSPTRLLVHAALVEELKILY